jgi:hypothetical protein
LDAEFKGIRMFNFFYESMWLKRKLCYLHVSNSCSGTPPYLIAITIF